MSRRGRSGARGSAGTAVRGPPSTAVNPPGLLPHLPARRLPGRAALPPRPRGAGRAAAVLPRSSAGCSGTMRDGRASAAGGGGGRPEGAHPLGPATRPPPAPRAQAYRGRRRPEPRGRGAEVVPGRAAPPCHLRALPPGGRRAIWGGRESGLGRGAHSGLHHRAPAQACGTNGAGNQGSFPRYLPASAFIPRHFPSAAGKASHANLRLRRKGFATPFIWH